MQDDFSKIRYNKKRFCFLNIISVRTLMILLKNIFVVIFDKLEKQEKIKFVLELDNFIYPFQGRAAAEYGDGIHPKHRLMQYHDFFIDNISEGDSVLDVGCGNGALTYDIAVRSGCRSILAIDINEDNINIAKKRFLHEKLTFIIGDATEYVFKESYDVVVLSNVLEHLKYRSNFLHQLKENVNFNRLLIRIPMYERDWRVPLKEELGIEYLLDPTHELEYTTEIFEKELDAVELKIEKSIYKWGELWAVIGVAQEVYNEIL